MASKYGYMAKIGADTSGLQNALKNVEADARNISAELRAVNEGLKFDPGNTDLLKQKQDLLAQSIENTSQKLEKLKSVQEDVNKAVENGDLSVTEQQRYTREIANTESQLRRYQTELNSTQTKINSAEKETEELRKATKEFADTADEAGEQVVDFGDILGANIAGNLIADGLREAGSAVKEFIVDGIEFASNLNEVQNVVDTTFEDGAGKVYSWAASAKANFGISSLAAQKYNGVLGAMLKSQGIAADSINEMSTSLTGLAGDMASFHNLEVEAAFEKIRSGISGETEPLKQLGIDMSVANLEAYALAQGIETAYNKMSQAEKAQLRYNYLMAQTADVHGDFAKTAGEQANQQRIFNLNMEELAAVGGEQVLPVLNDITKTVNEEFPKAMPIVEKIGETTAKIISLVVDNGEAVISGIGGIAAGLGTYTVATKGAAAATKLFAAATSMTPVGWVATIIGATVALVGLADALSDTEGNYKEWIEEANQGITEQENKVSDLEDELQSVNDKIEEIKAKGTLTLTDEAELARLRLQNDELSTQLAIEQEILKVKQQQQEEDAINMLYDTNGYEGSIAYAEEQVEAYKNMQNELAFWKAEQAKGAESEYDSTYIDGMISDWERQEAELRIAALESVQAAQSFSAMLSGTTEESKEAQAAVDELGKALLVYFDEIDIAANEAVEKAEKIGDNRIKSPTEIMAENVALRYKEEAEAIANGTNENLIENAYKDFAKSLESQWKSIEHTYAIGNVTEEEMWKEKRRLINLYGDETKEEYWKYYEEIADYEKESEKERLKLAEDAEKERLKLAEEAAEAELKTWEKGTKKISDTLTDSYKELVDEKEKIRDDLLSIDLSETVTTKDGKEIEVLTNLDEQVKKIDRYKASLDRLKNTGISDSLLAEIQSMNFEDGSRQRFIDSLLGLSQDKLNLYYSDWERLQVKSEQVSQDIISGSAEELNKETTAAIKSTFGAMPAAAYAEGVETAQSYLQGIIDSMGGINSIDTISQMFTGAFSGSSASSGNGQKMIPADTKIVFNIDGKKYIETSVQELIDKGQRTGGNLLNL